MITLFIKYWKEILAILAVLIISIMANALYNMSTEKARAQENVRQMQEINSTLTLTSKEFKEILNKSEMKSVKHIDSLFKANKINPKGVVEEHNLNNNYYKKDSTIVMIPINNITLPISIGDKCWGFTGTISNLKLEIKEKHFNVETDLVDYAKPKKFLGIIWGWHPPDMKAFVDCGTVTVKSYKRAPLK